MKNNGKQFVILFDVYINDECDHEEKKIRKKKKEIEIKEKHA